MAVEHASRLATEWVGRGGSPAWRSVSGSAVLVDISGFTRLAERLTGLGPEGPELLHRAVDECFAALLAGPIELGGDIVGFAGDAALIWFAADEFDDHARRAVEAASRMPRDLRAVPAALTGGRRLQVSAGVHTGLFHVHLVGATFDGVERRAVIWCGAEISTLARLEAAAGPGQVAMSGDMARSVPPSWCGGALETGVVLRAGASRRRPDHVHPPHRSDVSAGSVGSVRSLVSPAVLEVLRSEPVGEHRTVSVAFVRLGGLEARFASAGAAGVHAALERATVRIAGACRDHAVEWIDVDVGIDSVKFLLAAGAPRAVDDDEQRLLAALHEIVSDEELPLAAGAQCGGVFAALLGVGDRRTYTLLGDPVNVAARALERAGIGEIVVADGVWSGDGVVADGEALGDVAVRNRALPVPMWRIRHVGARTARSRARGGVATATVRAAAARQLDQAWQLATDGTGSVLSLVGEPGMGASDLIAHLTDRAGSSAVVVTADRFRRSVAYEGVGALVAELAAADGRGADRRDAWHWLASFSDRLPADLRTWVTDALGVVGASPTTVLDSETSARRARVVIAALLAAVLPSPGVVAVDDVDDWDEASRLVLARLCEVAGARLVLTSRSDPHARPLPGERVIALEPLSDDAAQRLVVEVAPQLRDEQVRRIVASAGGNPFVLVELSQRPLDGELPDSLRRLGNLLLDALPGHVRRRVRDVSVFGSSLALEDAAAVLGDPAISDPETWRPAASVVRIVDTRTLEFRHEAYRRAAWDSLPFRRRRELHGAIAERLLAHGLVDEAVVALHLGVAGRGADAAPLAASAGRRAKQVGAFAEAVELLDRAIAWTPSDVAPDELASLRLDAGEVRRWIGDFEGAERYLRSAARCARGPLVLGRACHLVSHVALHRGNLRVAKSWADRGLAAVAPIGGDAGDVRSLLLLDLAARHDVAGRHRRSIAMAEEALRWAEHHGSPLLVGLAHLNMEMSYSALLDERAVLHGDRAVAIFRELGHDRFLEGAWSNTGLTAMYLGRWDDAIRRYRHAIECAERAGQSFDTAAPVVNIGFVMYRRGELDEAESHARRALRLVAGTGSSLHSAHPWLLLALIAAARHRFVEADEYVAEARASATARGDETMVVDCDVTTMHCRSLAGRWDEVRALARVVEPRLAAAEVETAVACSRILGVAETMSGRSGTGFGIDRVRRALSTARDRHLLYEVHQCLAAVVAAGVGDPSEHAELAELGRTLGIVGKGDAASSRTR